MSPGEFAALPEVVKAVASYARQPVLDYGSGDLAGFARRVLQGLDAAGTLEPVMVAAMLGEVTEGGVSAFTPDEAGTAGRAVELLRDLRPVLERMAVTRFATEGPGLKPNLAQRRLVVRLARAWIDHGQRLSITHDTPSALDRKEHASGAFVTAVLEATKDLPEGLRLTPDAIDAQVRALRRAGDLPAADRPSTN